MVQVVELKDQHIESLIKGDRAILLYFYADWCTVCRSTGRFLTKISERQDAPDLTVLKINADSFPDLVDFYQVTALPDFKLFRNGEMIFQKSGSLSVAGFDNILQLVAQ